MKSFRLLGLAAALWSISIIPAAAGGYGNNSANNLKGQRTLVGGLNVRGACVPPLGPAYSNRPEGRYGNGLNVVSSFNGGGRDFGRGRGKGGGNCDWNGGGCNNNWGGGCNNNCGGDGGWSYGYWGGPFYPYGPYSAADRVDYSVNTPSPLSNSPYQIRLNDGIHLSPLDSGYPGPLPAVGGWYNPYPPQPTMIPAPGAAGGIAPAPTGPDVDLVVGVQRQLRRLGYYQGVVNGVSDARTRSAIRAYEAGIGLPVTGVIGTVLVRSLGLF